MKINRLIVISLILILLSGCVENIDKKVYFSPETNQTLILYQDNTMTLSDEKQSLSGTYRIDGDKIILIFAPFGSTVSFTRLGDDLVYDRGGLLYKRK